MCRIPDRLWKIAANLSPQYPISTICENLGLNWGTLKKKINHYLSSSQATHPVQPVPPIPPQEQPSFVELKLDSQEQAPSLVLNPSPSSSPHCAIELTKPDGTVMKIFASNDADSADSPQNLLELFKTFLGDSK